MAQKRKRRLRPEYWIFDRGVLLRADGRPIILKDRKTAERFIAEMGMGKDWEIEERQAPALALETRGRKPKDDPAMKRAQWAWAMMKPEEQPTRFEDQRTFMEQFHGPATGNYNERRRAVRAFIKKIQRLHQKALKDTALEINLPETVDL